MEQVIVNLVVNARDAMPWGGRLLIETMDADLTEALGQDRFSIPPGRYVALSVSDTGVGMDTETRAHIFEPFFTTKAAGQGTGLGLATVYGIVKQSAGYVWAESQPGRGTTLRLFLPRVEADLDEASDLGLDPRRQRAAETILLVEDDEAVCAIARETLEAEGYQVLVARGGEEALAIARDGPPAIHLLFTDVVMPGMNGHQLAARLQEVRPRTRVLYTSGYDEETVLTGAASGQAVTLPKPYRPDDLVQKVREVLDAAELET
jgi:two-component system, cell cycle sensor histidine kinase and response regulator CckA